MATKTAGGRITGHLALTCEAAVGLAVGDFVHLTAAYTVGLADGTKTPIGYVSVKNVKRTVTATTDSFPVANPGGDVTIEARGFSVVSKLSGGAITVGGDVGINASGALVNAGAGVATIGVALTAAAGAGTLVDVLVQ